MEVFESKETLLDLTVLIIMCVIFVFGVVLNLTAIVMIYKNEELGSLQNYLLINLFLSGLVLAFTIPLKMMENIMNDELCNILHYFDFVSLNTTSISLIMGAAERYFAVVRPLSWISLRRKGSLLCSFMTYWIVSFLVSIPVFMIFYEHGFDCHLISQYRKRAKFVVSINIILT